jgi:ornithine cyclodeaminase
MVQLSAEQTTAALPFGGLVDSLLAVLRDKRDGKAYAPDRVAVPLADGGVLLLMPAADGRIGITKLVTVHPGNVGTGLPVVQAEVMLMNAATGERLLMLDGNVVTARRTAALSMLATKLLAPEPAGPLLVVGAGVQGRSHVEAMVEGVGVREVYVVSRTRAHAESLAEHARQLGANARVVAEAGEALDKVTLIVTATTSPTPVLGDAGVREDTFIAAVGAFQPDTAEIPPDLVRRCRLYVDTLEGTRDTAGDLIQAGVDWGTVTALENALDAPRPRGGPVLFKSVGHALWDLAAARLALDRL